MFPCNVFNENKPLVPILILIQIWNALVGQHFSVTIDLRQNVKW